MNRFSLDELYTQRQLLFVFEFNSERREHAGTQASDNHFSQFVREGTDV